MTEAPLQDDISFSEMWSGLTAWCRRRPLDAVLAAMLFGTLFYFFGCYHVFLNGLQTTAEWAQRSWNTENDLEHGPLILPAVLFMVWYHRADLAAAPKRSSLAGLPIVLLGVMLFVFSVRTLQPRVAELSFPILCYGMVWFIWGHKTARVILFPCVFVLFMMPIGFLISRTVALQTFTAAVAAKLSGYLHIAVDSDGAYLRALDGSFNFEVAGGCSGIRSLTAMTMLAALYVHFTQRSLWRKALIFGSSLFFALIGNLMRIFTVVLFAHYISATKAAELYHDYSGFIFFPVAVGAMVAFAALVNRDWAALLRSPAPASRSQPTPPVEARPNPTVTAKPAGPISYDY